MSINLQIQNEGNHLQLGAKDALLNSLLVAAKKFSSGPPQILQLTWQALLVIVVLQKNALSVMKIFQ